MRGEPLFYDILLLIFLGSIILAYILLHIACVQYGPTCGFFCISYVLWRKNKKTNRYKTVYRLMRESDTKVGEIFDTKKVRKILTDNHVEAKLVRVYSDRDIERFLSDNLLILPVRKGSDPHYVIVEGSTKDGYCFVRDTALSIPLMQKTKDIIKKHDEMKDYRQYSWDSFMEREKKRYRFNSAGKWIHNFFCAIFFGKLHFLEKRMLKNHLSGEEEVKMYPEAVAVKLSELQ
jgi:hypothetical protein